MDKVISTCPRDIWVIPQCWWLLKWDNEVILNIFKTQKNLDVSQQNQLNPESLLLDILQMTSNIQFQSIYFSFPTYNVGYMVYFLQLE